MFCVELPQELEKWNSLKTKQTFACSKPKKQTLKRGLKYVNVNNMYFYCWLLTYFTAFSSVSVVEFEQVFVYWKGYNLELVV